MFQTEQNKQTDMLRPRDNKRSTLMSSETNLTFFIILILCCFLYSAFMYSKQTEPKGKIQIKPIRKNITRILKGRNQLQLNYTNENKERTRHKNDSYIITRSALTYTQRDIIESPKIEFLPQFKSACFYEEKNSR